MLCYISSLQDDTNILPVTPPLSCKLAPNGSLTLGLGHTIYDGNLKIIPYSGMLGIISLFRMWGRERSEEEVTSLSCTEGDLVKWVWDHWDTVSWDPVPDTSLKCGEFGFLLYETGVTERILLIAVFVSHIYI